MSQPPSNKPECQPDGSEDSKPQPAIHAEEKNDTITNYCKYNGYHQYKISWPSKLTAVCTIAIAIITGAYTHYAGKQVELMKRTIKTQITANKLDQRAWLGVMTITGICEIGKPIFVEVKIKNTGKTPAIKTNTFASIQVMERDKIPQYTFEDVHESEISRSIITPQAEVKVVPRLIPDWQDEIRDKIINNILVNKLILYVHGVVIYDDIFENHHWLIFCYIYDPHDKTWAAYKGHNETGNGNLPPYVPFPKVITE